MNGKKLIISDGFKFWGDGNESDFEDSVNSAQNKRPRSLNEAVYAVISARKKRQQESSKVNDNQLFQEGTCTMNTSLGQAKPAVSNNESTVLQDTSVQNSPASNYDEEVYDHMAMQEITQLAPRAKSNFCYNFSSQLVEKEVFKDIVDRIPFSGPRPRVIEIKKVWVDHKTFGLSMRVFGTVSRYTLNMMGQAVMVEQFEKAKLGLLPSGSWYRHIVPYERAVLLPFYHDQFWYLVVANFRHRRFKVLCPNLELDLIRSNAQNSNLEL